MHSQSPDPPLSSAADQLQLGLMLFSLHFARVVDDAPYFHTTARTRM